MLLLILLVAESLKLKWNLLTQTRLRLSQAGFRGTKYVIKTGLVFSSSQLCFPWLVFSPRSFLHVEVKMSRGAHVVLAARFPTDRSVSFSALPTKLPGNTLLVLFGSYKPLPESLTGARAWSPLAILVCAYHVSVDV